MGRVLLKSPLLPHPDSRETDLLLAIYARHLADGRLLTSFVLHGELLALRLPKVRRRDRRDGLWQSTCFEAFLRKPGSSAYVELNFSPQGSWAAYEFDDYREGMRTCELPYPPEIRQVPNEYGTEVEVRTVLPHCLQGCETELALSAVIEEKDGTKSYWALHHPPGKPDFHHPDCFVLTLPPPAGS